MIKIIYTKKWTVSVHSGKYCYGKTPWQTFQEAKHLAQMKMLDALHEIDIVNEVIPVNSSSV